MSDQTFGDLYYARHTARRLEHLASLGLDLWSKSVLEIGAGSGELTGFFLDRRCSVTALEPRPDNVRAFSDAFPNRRFPAPAMVRLLPYDVDALPQVVSARFDIVFCYGLLYHTRDPGRVLQLLAERCAGLLLLETCVTPGAEVAINPVAENATVASQAFDGAGCRPTRPWVVSCLRTLFPFVYVPATQPAHEEFPTDWTVPPAHEFTRAVFVASRQKLDSPLLLDHLPDRQRPA